MFEEEVCVCMSCLDFPAGTAAAHKSEIQESVLATRYLSVNLRSMDVPYSLFEEMPLSIYKVAPLSRLEDEWLRAEANEYLSHGASL
jgi:hypothetical protein